MTITPESIRSGEIGRSWLWGLLLTCYCSLIFYLSSRSMLPVPDLFSMQDKLIHAAAYALMAFLFWNAGRFHVVAHSQFTLEKLLLMTVIFCSLYGASDEWHQSFVAGRDASLFDWLADTLGALLLTLALWKREVGVLERE